MAQKIIYVTDVHGETEVFKKALAKAVKKKAIAVIYGGDLNSHMTLIAVNGIEIQRVFLQEYFIPLLESFKGENIDIFTMMGNDDYSINMDILESAEKKGLLKIMHNKTHDIGDKKIIGYSFVNPSDHLIFPINDWVKDDKKIKKDLDKLTKKMDYNYIFATHAPPYNTNLDIFYEGDHVGSSAIRDIIKKKQPRLALSGHIHESPMFSGDIKDNIDKTLCINPGNEKIISIDLDSLKISKRL